MKTRAALLWQQPGKWEIAEVDLDAPGYGEVLVEMVASGLCHSDDHYATGDLPVGELPLCGGHEGAGIVRAIGPGVSGLAEDDHIITSFIPACGHCKSCVCGMQNLCDNGALISTGRQLDGTCRMHVDGTDVRTSAVLGTFSEWQVLDQLSCVKVPKDVPLNVVCVLACGVPTGWGSAANAAGIRSGDVVLVIGCGGIGINAVQGAAHTGASRVVAVDPQPFKREMALKLGATEVFADLASAREFVGSLTNGQGAASAIVAIGVTTGQDVADAFQAVRKAGTVVVTGIGKFDECNVPISLLELSMYQKRLQGSLYGSGAPREQIPALLDLYRSGVLKLDELVTRRYRLDDINEAYADMHAGTNIRGVIEFGGQVAA
jgi:NDMA-dependent alcohol dehydrogenase